MKTRMLTSVMMLVAVVAVASPALADEAPVETMTGVAMLVELLPVSSDQDVCLHYPAELDPELNQTHVPVGRYAVL